MKINKNHLIVYIIFITIFSILILLIQFRDTLNSNYIYISTIANVIVIFLMLITIIITEESTRKQIESWEKWNNLQRKQFLKTLIRELKFNLEVYEKIQKKDKSKEYVPQLNNFIFVNIEKSLQNTPTDIELINDNLIKIFYNMKIDENKIKITRMPGISEKTIKWYIQSISKDYESMQKSLKFTIKLLEKYENDTKIEIIENKN